MKTKLLNLTFTIVYKKKQKIKAKEKPSSKMVVAPSRTVVRFSFRHIKHRAKTNPSIAKKVNMIRTNKIFIKSRKLDSHNNLKMVNLYHIYKKIHTQEWLRELARQHQSHYTELILGQ